MDAHLEYKVCLIKSKPWCVNCVIIYFCLRKLKSCKRKIFSVVRLWRQGGMVSSQLLVFLYLIETLTTSSLHWMVYTTGLNYSLRLKMSIWLVSSGHIIIFSIHERSLLYVRIYILSFVSILIILLAEVPQKSLNCFNFPIFFLTSIWQFCEQSEINPQHRTTEKLSPEWRAKDEEGICWEITQWAWKYKRAVEIYERR